MKVNLEKLKELGLYEEPEKPEKKTRAAPDIRNIISRIDVFSYPRWVREGAVVMAAMFLFCLTVTGLFVGFGPPGSGAGRQDAVMTASVEPAETEKQVQVTQMDIGSAGDTLQVMQMTMKNVPEAVKPVTENEPAVTDMATVNEAADSGTAEEQAAKDAGETIPDEQESEDTAGEDTVTEDETSEEDSGDVPVDEDSSEDTEEDDDGEEESSGDNAEDDAEPEEEISNDDEEPEEEQEEEEEEVLLAVAKVDGMLNVRAEASEDADVVGMLYKDSGGKILEQENGWTQIESGDLTGWVQDELLETTTEEELLSSEKAVIEAKVNVTSLNVRADSNTDAQIVGGIKNGDIVEVVNVQDNGWAEVKYDDSTAYINTSYAEVGLSLQTGDTIEAYIEKVAEQKKAKVAKAEENAADAGLEVTVTDEYEIQDASDIEMLATIIYCEAGNQSYEGKVAVGNVVLNRVASSRFPNDINSVLRASRQFQPVTNGKYDRMLNSGRIPQSCYDAAQEAIDGISYVGDCLFFKNPKLAGAHSGIPIGDHVFW